MAKLLYCWRCKMEVPMLDEQEWQQIGAPEGNLIQAMKDYQSRYGVTLAVAKGEAPKEILARYKNLTGFEETNVNTLYHHRIDLWSAMPRMWQATANIGREALRRMWCGSRQQNSRADPVKLMLALPIASNRAAHRCR